MKALIYILIALTVVNSQALVDTNQLIPDKKLVLPDYKSGPYAEKIVKFENMLAQGDLTQFYKTCRAGIVSNEVFKAFSRECEPKKKIHIAKAYLAICGMIISAPVFTRDIMSKKDIEFDSEILRKSDLVCKKVFMVNLNTLQINMMLINSKESREIQEMAVLYFAYGVKFHKLLYNPELTAEWANKKVNDKKKEFQNTIAEHYANMTIEERVTAQEKDEEKTNSQYREEVVAYSNNVILLSDMNGRVKEIIEFGEDWLIKLLVRVYPGKRAKAWELIMEAGYTKEEIPDLLKRTVGRNPKTEFLFPDAKKK